ncbi:GxxExxY protein [Hymenobacter sp. UV11]|uniref:GxxExxY protein n=1 Tax=Hymenobacter sp. UV11 TaxID=1849735 RepID=UPI001060DB86|nr:GxxExxY protein [Hymenobacter sp. UV11]TDN37345.1 GxxExxY protein [Hymenobacter sp. UV11]TFZ68533.1 GxxExxY protein [Hymenobacter sp. UV11]
MILDNRHGKLTEVVIGCAMEVHRTLGTGFQEVIYQRSLAVEMEKAGVVFGREIEMPLFYKGVDVGSRRVDFLVGNSVLVELKALHELTPTHYAQIINYLEAYQLEVGLLINFGERSLRFKRFIKSQQKNNP